MTQHKRSESSPKGPEGVPVDAPGNDGPALSPHAVSRMHRSEDDGEAFARSPEYSDDRSIANEDRGTATETRDRSQGGTEREAGGAREQWLPGAPGSGDRTDAARGLDAAEEVPHEPNPAHHAAKSDQQPPRGRGDGELMDQPGSTAAARQPGARDAAPRK